MSQEMTTPEALAGPARMQARKDWLTLQARLTNQDRELLDGLAATGAPRSTLRREMRTIMRHRLPNWKRDRIDRLVKYMDYLDGAIDQSAWDNYQAAQLKKQE